MDLDSLRRLLDRVPLCVQEIDADGHVLAMSCAGLALLGIASEETVRGRDYLDFVSAADKDRARRALADAFAGRACDLELSTATPISRRFVSCFIPCANTSGRIERLICISRDISLHQETETALRRLSRTYAVLSRCNHSLARAIEERDLLNAFCTNLVEVGGYSFAWVGYADRKHPPRVRLVAHAGLGRTELAATGLARTNAGERPCACRIAVATGQSVVIRCIANEPHLAPWAETVLRLGYRSMIALPLCAHEAPFGSFSLFSRESDAFDAPELALLEQLAQDLAFGIHTARTRAAEAQKVRQLRDEVERDARRRLAGTLHDRVGQSMQAINLGLKRVRAMAATDAPIPAELLAQLIDEVGTSIRALRDIGRELRPLYFERLPLIDAIRFHCREACACTGVAIRVRADETEIDLDERVKEQCFLGFREALTNALKHSGARRIHVVVNSRRPGRLSLTIVDDGVGFDIHEAFRQPAGLGLSMILERAECVFGRARIRSRPGKGTRVRISVPLTKETGPCLQ